MHFNQTSASFHLDISISFDFILRKSLLTERSSFPLVRMKCKLTHASRDIKAHVRLCNPQKTPDIRITSTPRVKEHRKGSLHFVRYCFWQQGFTLTGESLWDKGVSKACSLYMLKCMFVCVPLWTELYKGVLSLQDKNMRSTPAYIQKTIWLLFKWKTPLNFSPSSCYFLFFFSPCPPSLSFLSPHVCARSFSLNPHRHLCDNNGTPVGVRLVSLWQ